MDQPFDAKKKFDESLKTLIVPALKQNGFLKTSSRRLARIVDDSILQIIDLRGNRSGENEFVTEIVVRPLFIPKENVMPFSPIADLGKFKPKLEGPSGYWASYNTPEELEITMEWLHNALINLGLPWLERMSTIQGIVEEFKSPTQTGIVWGGDYWEFDLGVLYLSLGLYQEAFECFEKVCIPELGPFVFTQAQAFRELVDQGPDAVQAYLAKAAQENCERWKLPKKLFHNA